MPDQDNLRRDRTSVVVDQRHFSGAGFIFSGSHMSESVASKVLGLGAGSKIGRSSRPTPSWGPRTSTAPHIESSHRSDATPTRPPLGTTARTRVFAAQIDQMPNWQADRQSRKAGHELPG